MQDQSPAGNDEGNARMSRIFLLRLLIALLQAAALYLLTKAATEPLSWPATTPRLFGPLLLVSIYVPLLLIVGLGQMRTRQLSAWAVIAAIAVAALAYHDAARGRVSEYSGGLMPWPWFHLWLALSAGIFIAHVLVVDSVAEGRLAPSYARHFNTAWKLGVQAALASAFVGMFWLMLHLGAELFKLLGIIAIRDLISHDWFGFPASTLALAVSLHVTDVQPALIRGIRTIILTLFSWLLPLLALIILGFLGSLLFTSLAPLWQTHFATELLLTSAALLVFLINSCYQDGAPEHTASRIKRLAGTLGAIELVPLLALAIRALSLRVGQYGWTTERILAAAAIVLGCCYAIGYASAAIRARTWLKRLEMTNFIAAYLFLAMVVLLFSPIADPARLMVASQVARLRSGATVPEKFDFAALKFDGARWGASALAELAKDQQDPNAAAIRSRAADAIAMTDRYGSRDTDYSAGELAAHVTVLPQGRTLPPVFYEQAFWKKNEYGVPRCVNEPDGTCLARYIALRPGAPEAILFLDDAAGNIFEQDAGGQWQLTGRLSGLNYCAKFQSGLKNGDIRLEPHAWPDLVIGGLRMNVLPSEEECP